MKHPVRGKRTLSEHYEAKVGRIMGVSPQQIGRYLEVPVE